MSNTSAKVFIDLVDTLKDLGSSHFELLLYIQLENARKPMADITLSELLDAAKAAKTIKTQRESQS
jgi:hypothetical protein